MEPRYLYGIIGQPLEHSASPALHNWGFARTGWPAAYYRWPTPPAGLGDMLRACRALPIHGLSVTLPHKQAIMPLLDTLTPAAREVGAVNTLYWEEGRLVGHNTDLAGFLAPLRAMPALPDSALVLGAGGAARAVLAGLRTLGLGKVCVSARSPGKAHALARDFGVESVPWEERMRHDAGLLVNATPLGLHGELAGASPWPAFAGTGIAYDLVYNPLETRFLRDAQSAGWQTLDGLDMLVAQGVEQFRLWTGHTLEVTAARAVLLPHLAALATHGEAQKP